MNKQVMKRAAAVLTCIVLFTIAQVSAQSKAIDPSNLNGQDLNAITTAVPFLTIAPDSRAGAMGDIGCATSADANSQSYNPAKYVFSDNQFGFSLSYSPWLRQLVNDINLLYLSGYWRITDMDAIGASLRYFSLGDIEFMDENGQLVSTQNPNEFAIDFTYSRKLIDQLSIAITPRFIYSNLTAGQFVGGEETKELFVASAKCAGGRVSFEYDVEDKTPWVNGASDFRNMYAMGDTVDFQLADANGDLRLSVGSLQGKAAAALYKPKSKTEKAPHTFFSGVYRDGVTWELVKEIPVEAKVEKREGGYKVSFSVAEKDLGLAAPLAGRAVKGDFGVTFGDTAGRDTVLRVFKFNKETGIVSDEVEELKLQPNNWGEIAF